MSGETVSGGEQAAVYFGVEVPRPSMVGSTLICPVDGHAERFGMERPSALLRYVRHCEGGHVRPVPLQEAWFCTICGIEAPDYIGSMSRTNRRNNAGRRVGVIALPCGHEQPSGLGYGIPPSVLARRGPQPKPGAAERLSPEGDDSREGRSDG